MCSLLPLLWTSIVMSAEADLAVPEFLWSHNLERPLQFHNLVDSSVLIAGTGRHLYAFDPQTGEQRWRVRNVNPTSQDVYRVNDTGTLLITDAAGGAFDDADTHVLALSVDDGLLLWESPRLEGRVVQGVITEDSSTAYITTVGEAHGDDRGMLASPISGKGLGAGVYREPRLLSLNLVDGHINWRAGFRRNVRMRPAAARYRGERPFDFGNYHRPILVGSMLCVTYYGVRCLNRLTGATIWDREFPVVEDSLALAYARPVVAGEVIYLTGDNRIHAHDLLSGDRLWRSKKANLLPELLIDDDMLYSQLGGRFFHLGNERWVWKGEFGVMGVDRDTGKTRWRFDDAKGAITNLHIENDLVWFADRNRLFALDKRSGKQLLRVKHRMEETPVFMVINLHGHRVLISDDEVVAFDLSGTRIWAIRHPAPTPGAWRRVSEQLSQLSGNLLRITSMAVSMTSGLIPSVPIGGVNIISGKSVVKRATRSVGNSLSVTGKNITDEESYAALEDSYQYFITTRLRDERIFLATVDVNAGTTVGMTPLPAASTDIVIDDQRGLLLQAEGSTLTAVSIRGRSDEFAYGMDSGAGTVQDRTSGLP